VLPGEDLSGEVGVQQTLLEEQGDDTATPYLGEGRGGSLGDEEEGVVPVEAAFQQLTDQSIFRPRLHRSGDMASAEAASVVGPP
jgi:hypothetical protein